MSSTTSASPRPAAPEEPPPGDEAAGRSRLERLRDPASWADWAALVGLVVLVVVFSLTTDTFLTLGNLEAVLLAAAILVVLAVGQTFVVTTAGIDLSIASNLTLGAVVLGQAWAAGLGIVLSCVLAVVASTVVGLVNGFIIARGGITDFIVTLGMLSAASGVALVLSDGRPVQVTSGPLLTLSTGSAGPFGYTVLVAAAVAVVAHVVLFHTRFGLHVLAVGGSKDSARAMGVAVVRVKVAVYAIAGVLAGLAAIMLVARLGAAEPAASTTFLLNAVAAVVLGGVSLFGGRGTIAGPVVGALLLQTLTNGLTLLGVSQFYQPVAVGSVVVAAAFLSRYQR